MTDTSISELPPFFDVLARRLFRPLSVEATLPHTPHSVPVKDAVPKRAETPIRYLNENFRGIHVVFQPVSSLSGLKVHRLCRHDLVYEPIVLIEIELKNSSDFHWTPKADDQGNRVFGILYCSPLGVCVTRPKLLMNAHQFGEVRTGLLVEDNKGDDAPLEAEPIFPDFPTWSRCLTTLLWPL
jgi:hypothetical protein